jgi:hypothetical protein
MRRDTGRPRHAGGVERAVAAEGDHHPVAEILARLHGMHPARACHALIDDLADAEGGFRRRRAFSGLARARGERRFAAAAVDAAGGPRRSVSGSI